MNIRRILLLLLLPLLFSACTSYKKSLYLRDDEVLEMVPQKGMLYEYRIMPKDELTILVSTSAPEASAPFYRKFGQTKDQASTNQGMENAKLLAYLVDNDGYIDFPILGMIKVVGLTNRECEALLRQKLLHYLNEDPTLRYVLPTIKSVYWVKLANRVLILSVMKKSLSSKHWHRREI